MGELSKLGFHDGMTVETAKRHAERLNARYLGNGMSTTAFRVSWAERPEYMYAPMPPINFGAAMPDYRIQREDRVIRVSDMNLGGYLTYKAARQFPDDPYAPKVYDMMLIQGGNIVFTELLRELRIGPMWGVGPMSSQLPEGEFDDDRTNAGRKVVPSRELRLKSPFVNELFRLVRLYNVRFDIHSENIMRRADGHIVVSDPLYASKARYVPQGQMPIPEPKPQRLADPILNRERRIHDAIMPPDRIDWPFMNGNLDRMIMQEALRNPGIVKFLQEPFIRALPKAKWPVVFNEKVSPVKSEPITGGGISKALKLKREADAKRVSQLKQLGGNMPAKLGKLK